MNVSLILATVGRSDEVETFLESLTRQTHSRFEVILVDQNEDGRLLPLIKRYEGRFPLRHVRSARGLSRARNVGLLHATGDVVGFPDDDCRYAPDTLATAVALLEREPKPDVVTGRSVDDEGNDSNGKFDREAGPVDRFNVWSRAISFTIFLRRRVIDAIGGFDEGIGVGAGTIYLSGEETDYVLRALNRFRVVYDPQLAVYHADPLRRMTQKTIARAYQYGCGFGKVVAKHRYPASFRLRSLLRPLAGSVLFVAAGRLPRSRYYWNSFRGRLRGML